MTAQHDCTEKCQCPIHHTPLIYAPGTDDHACQDASCPLGHGLMKWPVTIREDYGTWDLACDGWISVPTRSKVSGVPPTFASRCGAGLPGSDLGEFKSTLLDHLLRSSHTEEPSFRSGW